MLDLTDHDRRLLRKLSIAFEGVANADALDGMLGAWAVERKVGLGTPLALAARLLVAITLDRLNGEIDAATAKAEMGKVWEATSPDYPPPDWRMLDWTREMEKKLCDRVQVVLSDPRLFRVLQDFGPEVFRRSSIFHGLDELLSREGVRGGTCFEVGTWNGLTAIVLSRYFDKVVTVDIAHNALKRRIIAELGLESRIVCHDIGANADKARVAADTAFDFAYLDGDHAHDTDADFALVRRCGRVLFHEVWPFQPPVWRLVRGLPGNEVTYGGDGLALWRSAAKRASEPNDGEERYLQSWATDPTAVAIERSMAGD